MGNHETLEAVKTAADLASVAAVIGVLMSWLPSMAAILTVLWLGVRLFNEIMVSVKWVKDLRRPVQPREWD